LFGVSETSDIFTFHQRLTVRSLDVAKRAGCVTNQGNRLACGQERPDQFDRVRIFGQIPHRAVAARVENRVVIIGLDTVEANGRSELRLCSRIGFEPAREVGLEVRLVAFGIERRLSTLRRGQHNLSARVLEYIVRGSKFLEPKAGLAARVAEFVVRGKYHQDLHTISYFNYSFAFNDKRAKSNASVQ